LASRTLVEKMSAYALTPLAKSDILEIWSYIAAENVGVADRVEQAIFDACEFLAGSSRRGHFRRDITPLPLCFWTLTRYPNYTIVYRPKTAPLQVVAVLHGKRNIRRILTNRP
jgi:plasmid stabilization system protein ParE